MRDERWFWVVDRCAGDPGKNSSQGGRGRWNLMSCLEPGHLLSNIYVHEALEFCPFLPLFLAFSMSFPRALRAVRVSEMSGGHFSPPAGSPTTVFSRFLKKPYSLQHMQFGDFPSQTLPIRWVKPLERNLNLSLSIVSTAAVLFTFHTFLSILDAGTLGQMAWVQIMMESSSVFVFLLL